MSEIVEVPFEGKARDKAVLLLAATKELDLPADVVQASTGMFLAPAEVVDQAFGPPGKPVEESAAKKAPAKKSAAKKSTQKPQE